jgi:hypothetical protein
MLETISLDKYKIFPHNSSRASSNQSSIGIFGSKDQHESKGCAAKGERELMGRREAAWREETVVFGAND